MEKIERYFKGIVDELKNRTFTRAEMEFMCQFCQAMVKIIQKKINKENN